MKKTLLASAFIVSMAACQVANAISFTSSTTGGAPSWATKENFDDLKPTSWPGANRTENLGNLTVTLLADAQVAINALSGKYAAPYVWSANNGIGFGQPSGDQPTGVDTTPYLSSGVKPYNNLGGGLITLSFTTPVTYFGLLWGSVDTYNKITFFNGATSLGSLSGANVLTNPHGSQGSDGSTYVNIFSDTPFTSVVIESNGSYAFEIDNVAYGVPDGGATMAMLGIGLMGLAGLRRKLA